MEQIWTTPCTPAAPELATPSRKTSNSFSSRNLVSHKPKPPPSALSSSNPTVALSPVCESVFPSHSLPLPILLELINIHLNSILLLNLQAQGYDITAEDYHSFVHGRLPYQLIKPDIQLRNILRSINQRKIVRHFLNFHLTSICRYFFLTF